MIKTVKNTRPRAHQRCLLWSQELSLRVIKTSPLLLLRWPIKNLFLQYRSCLQPIISTSTSISPASEPSPCPGSPLAHRMGTGPHHPKHLLRLPGILCHQALNTPYPMNLCLEMFFSPVSYQTVIFAISIHCNTNSKGSVCKSLIKNVLILRVQENHGAVFYFN